MWNRRRNNDILDFALLWQPLGGPAPKDIATAFSIDIDEYERLLQGAVRLKMSQLHEGVTSPEQVYGLTAIAALAQFLSPGSAGCPYLGVSKPSGLRSRSD